MAATDSSSETRPLTLRMRPDLEVRPVQYDARRCWGVKDPVSLRYFQLRDEEYFILRSLDGRASVSQLRANFERRFSPQKLNARQVHWFLGDLYRQGLLLSDTLGQGPQLWRRRREQGRRELLEAAANVLAIRFRGVDPEPFLQWLYPKCRWLFSRWCLAAWLSLVMAALIWLLVESDRVAARLPEMAVFFGWRNLVWLTVGLALAKVLHELGHALACKHFGGECHELGVMLLVFAPCLYCNVSDSWMLDSKWKRAAIGAAGMWVETALAAACVFLWWFSEPGLLNSLLLNLMVVCSVSTLVFNANPLLRFDGYFILADLLETANLQQRASAVALSWLRRTVLGMEEEEGPVRYERRPGLLGFYAAASTGYRYLVVAAIVWFCHQALRSHQLESLAHLLTLVVVGALAGPPLWRLFHYLRRPGIPRQVRWRRTLIWAALGSSAAAVLLLAPLPYRITAPVVLSARDATRIYVSTPGLLRQAARLGERVQAGQAVATLENLETRREVAELTGLRDLQQLHLTTLERRQSADPTSGDQIPVAREALADLEKRLEQRLRDEQKLRIVAPVAGVVLPAPTPLSPAPPPDELPVWNGQPLDERNLGALFETGSLLCLLGDPRKMEVLAVLDQGDLQFVEAGQPVRVQLEQLPGVVLTGAVAMVSEIRLDQAPAELVSAGLLTARQDTQGSARPLRPSYLARVALPDQETALVLGSPGQAKIEVRPRCLGSRLLRYLRRVFRFELLRAW